MNMNEMKVELERLESLKYDLKSLVSTVNNTTRDIKYNDAPMAIYTQIESLAEDNDIDISYEVAQVRNAVNDLESAIYDLVSPFEDKARDAENDFDDLDCTISDNIYWEKYPKEEDAA